MPVVNIIATRYTFPPGGAFTVTWDSPGTFYWSFPSNYFGPATAVAEGGGGGGGGSGGGPNNNFGGGGGGGSGYVAGPNIFSPAGNELFVSYVGGGGAGGGINHDGVGGTGNSGDVAYFYSNNLGYVAYGAGGIGGGGAYTGPGGGGSGYIAGTSGYGPGNPWSAGGTGGASLYAAGGIGSFTGAYGPSSGTLGSGGGGGGRANYPNGEAQFNGASGGTGVVKLTLNTNYLQYTAPGTYYFRVPDGATTLTVTVVGGGAGGGGQGLGIDSGTFFMGGGGGGGGGWIANYVFAVVEKQDYVIVVGAGGAGGFGPMTAGNPGGQGQGSGIYFNGNPVVTTTGGSAWECGYAPTIPGISNSGGGDNTGGGNPANASRGGCGGDWLLNGVFQATTGGHAANGAPGTAGGAGGTSYSSGYGQGGVGGSGGSGSAGQTGLVIIQYA